MIYKIGSRLNDATCTCAGMGALMMPLLVPNKYRVPLVPDMSASERVSYEDIWILPSP